MDDGDGIYREWRESVIEAGTQTTKRDDEFFRMTRIAIDAVMAAPYRAGRATARGPEDAVRAESRG